ncbi:MAG: hypothetical protein II453_15150 [Alphaproteobacteria bacterium]|nr:hypothetical protein [Alphaproteobacteria bacterium]
MAKLINEIGNTYGYLTVIDRAENDKEGRARWLCKCKCGNEVIVLGKHLRAGNTRSCGCYQKERAKQSNMARGGNLIGKRFGKLVVLEEAGFCPKSDGRQARLWKCQCDCGNICYVQHQYLTCGDTKSCGCLRSKGEFEIETLLKQHNVEFQREYSFSDLVDVNPLRFDFAIIKNSQVVCLIEFQGEQHWSKSNGFYNESIVVHDLLKKKYCESHNIPLYLLYYKDHKQEQVTWEELLKIKEIREYI